MSNPTGARCARCGHAENEHSRVTIRCLKLHFLFQACDCPGFVPEPRWRIQDEIEPSPHDWGIKREWGFVPEKKKEQAE